MALETLENNIHRDKNCLSEKNILIRVFSYESPESDKSLKHELESNYVPLLPESVWHPANTSDS